MSGLWGLSRYSGALYKDCKDHDEGDMLEIHRVSHIKIKAIEKDIRLLKFLQMHDQIQHNSGGILPDPTHPECHKSRHKHTRSHIIDKEDNKSYIE